MAGMLDDCRRWFDDRDIEMAENLCECFVDCLKKYSAKQKKIGKTYTNEQATWILQKTVQDICEFFPGFQFTDGQWYFCYGLERVLPELVDWHIDCDDWENVNTISDIWDVILKLVDVVEEKKQNG